MASPFTITAQNWQRIDKLDELRLAYSERTRILGQGWVLYREKRDAEDLPIKDDYDFFSGDGSEADTMGSTQPDQGFNAQSARFWYYMQEDISTFLVTDFYCYPSPTNYADLDSVFDSGDWLLPFGSWLNFCKFCGGTLYTSDTDYGWRKGTVDSGTGELVMSRGLAEAGDVLGFWLAEDLMLAFSKMTHIYTESDDSASRTVTAINVSGYKLDENGKIVISSNPSSMTGSVVNFPVIYINGEDVTTQPDGNNYRSNLKWSVDIKIPGSADLITINTFILAPSGDPSGGYGAYMTVQLNGALVYSAGTDASGVVWGSAGKFVITYTPATQLPNNDISESSVVAEMDDGDVYPAYTATFPAGSTGEASCTLRYRTDDDGPSQTTSYTAYKVVLSETSSYAYIGFVNRGTTWNSAADPSTKFSATAAYEAFDLNPSQDRALSETPAYALAAKVTSFDQTDAPYYSGDFSDPGAGGVSSLVIGSQTSLEAGWLNVDAQNGLETNQRLYMAWVSKGLFSNENT